MKKIIPLFIILCLLLCSCQPKADKNATNPQPPTRPDYKISEEMRGVWLSCYEFPSAADKTLDEYSTEAERIFSSLEAFGINTVFLHARAFSDAFYQSDIFPYSKYVAGEEGAELSFDPFEVMLRCARLHGIAVHAWINPYRVSASTDIEALSRDNPARKIHEGGNENGEIRILENGIYYNPASLEAQELVLDGIREILDKYEVAGIHIDDYFYPSTDESIDSEQYKSYIRQGGESTLSEWRRNNVNAFVAAAYSAVKSCGGDKIFSISPAAGIEKNKTQLFADVELWLSEPGYADWIIPQLYFGFNNSVLPFADTFEKWAALPKAENVRLMCGLAAYKCGDSDENAGSGSGEWLERSDILLRQLVYIRTHGNFCGFVLFSCNDILSPSNDILEAELHNLSGLLR